MKIRKYLPRRILTKSMGRFVGYLEIFSYKLMQTRLYYESTWLKSELPQYFW
jgi:hypothetical protein